MIRKNHLLEEPYEIEILMYGFEDEFAMAT